MKIISSFIWSAALLVGTTTATAQEVNLMLANGQTFIDTPYAAHTLEEEEVEELVINCDKVDCTTFVEYVLAMSLCPQQGDAMQEDNFASNLQRIRYRDGQIDGYTSRLHYISDWINNGIKGGFLEDVSATNSPFTQKLSLSYMSAHPEKYAKLAHSAANVSKMKAIEQALGGQEVHWTPKEQINANGLPWVRNGDIIAITAHTPGLDVAHMGIAIYVKGNLCLLHASSKKEKVLVDQLTLHSLLERNANWTGFRVLRMKK